MASKFFAVYTRLISSSPVSLGDTMSPSRHLLILGCSLLLVAVLAAGCMSIPGTTPPLSSELKKFNSTAEIEQYLAESMATTQPGGPYRTFVPTISTDAMQRSEMASGIRSSMPTLQLVPRCSPGQRLPIRPGTSFSWGTAWSSSVPERDARNRRSNGRTGDDAPVLPPLFAGYPCHHL